MKVIRNTYPKNDNCPHAEIGDSVKWKASRGHFLLIREADGKVVFSTAPVNNSNGKEPKLTGVIAQVKSKGWVIEISGYRYRCDSEKQATPGCPGFGM